MFADPSDIQSDTFSGEGIGINIKRSFSILLGAATHDVRQYCNSNNKKKSKYTESTVTMQR